MELKVKDKVLGELEKIVGTDFVSTSPADLYIYSQDMTENEPSWPDFMVMPGSVEEVQAILRLANKEKIPVVPYTAGGNIGGLTIPLKGGIVLDFKRMDRVIEFNEEDMYIVVEPGFTYGHMKRYLDQNCPDLTYNWAVAPPTSSVSSNALLQGLGYMSPRIGLNQDNINGLEVVLPTGEVVKIGSCAISPYWFNRAPLPDIAGLFIGWQGATGVVTKISLQLWPTPKHTATANYLTYDLGATCRFMRKLARAQIYEDNTMVTWGGMKGMMTAMFSEGKASLEIVPGEPECTMGIAITAYTEKELQAKIEIRDEIMKEAFKDTKFDIGQDRGFQIQNMRGTVDAYGGCSWAGMYGPLSNWEVSVPATYPIFDKYGFPRFVFCRPFRQGHLGQWRPIIVFDKGDAEEVERVRKCIRELYALGLDNGYIPYKAPQHAIELMMERADPNFVELLRRVKKMIDPSNIMNPGRYGAPKE